MFILVYIATIVFRKYFFMFKKFNLDIAERLDKEDKLSKFRDLFLFPEHKNKSVYILVIP